MVQNDESEPCPFCGMPPQMMKRHEFVKRKVEKLLSQNHALRDQIQSERFHRRAIESLQATVLDLDEDLLSARETIKQQRREITLLERKLRPRTIRK